MYVNPFFEKIFSDGFSLLIVYMYSRLNIHRKVYIPFLYTIIIAFLYKNCQCKFTVLPVVFATFEDFQTRIFFVTLYKKIVNFAQLKIRQPNKLFGDLKIFQGQGGQGLHKNGPIFQASDVKHPIFRGGYVKAPIFWPFNVKYNALYSDMI